MPCRRRSLIVIMTLGCLSCEVASLPKRCHPPPLLRLPSGKDNRCFPVPVSSGKGVYIDGGTNVLRKGEDLSEGGRRVTWRSLRLVLPGLLKDVGMAGAIWKVSACGFRGDGCVCVTIPGAGRGCSNAVERFKGTWAGDIAELIRLMSMSMLFLFVGRGFCSAWRIDCSIALYVCKTRSPESEALTLAFVSPESRLGCLRV